MKWFVWLFAIVCCLVLSAEEPVRTWTSLDGSAIKASFIEFADDKVVIRRDDGRSFKVSPAIFSEEDRKYLDELRAKPDAVQEIAPDAPILFKDAKLEAAVRKALKKDEGAFLREDLTMLESLAAPQAGITSLAGLEHLTNLTKLMLWNNQITEITPLANLTKLTSLNLSLNQIDEVTSLSKLTDLTKGSQK